MFRIRRVVAAAVLVLGSLGTAPASGQETVDFRLRLARGEVIYHAYTGSVQLSVETSSRSESSELQFEGRQVTRVLDVDAEGVMVVEIVFEDSFVREGNSREEIIDEPVVLRVRPDARVVEKRVGEFEGEDFPFGFPGRPVRVGETWARQTRVEEAGVTGDVTLTYTLAAVEGAAAARVARVTYQAEGRVSRADLGPLPQGATSRVSGTIQGRGEVFWSVDRGRPLRGSDELTIETRVEVSREGQTASATLTFRTTERREPLAAEQVTVPVVGADRLIAPGKGVGPFTLDLSVSAVTTRLGSPQRRRAEAGLRADAVVWPNGLTGYLDPADQTKLLGLEIADRAFRTDKGITFASSEGAVLMAYGSSPQRVTLTIPNLGGARLLIYSDLGVAFAITADRQHADAGPEHAPVGAVDWITVFPPGQAGRIFPLP